MTALVVASGYPIEGYLSGGGVKISIVKSTATTDAATYDTNMDATDGKGADFSEIFSAVVSDTVAGAGTPCAYSNTTGIITLPSGVPSTTYLRIEGI